jgi:hypothetical protein
MELVRGGAAEGPPEETEIELRSKEREALARIVEAIDRELTHLAVDSEWHLACLTIRRHIADAAGPPLALIVGLGR